MPDSYRTIYRRIFASAPSADVPWRDILNLLRHLVSAKLNPKNPGEVYIQEMPEEIVLAYKPFHAGGDQPIMVVRRKYEQVYALPDDLRTVQSFLIRAGFPEEIV